MKLVIQRVREASVLVDEKVVGEIGTGILILLGVMKGDKVENVDYLANKAAEFRMFHDENKRMNKSVLDIKGEILVVSQFTLAADGKKGRRPSFDQAAHPSEAIPLYEDFVKKLKSKGIKVDTGIFGAEMIVNIVNDGPVTFVLEHPHI